MRFALVFALVACGAVPAASLPEGLGTAGPFRWWGRQACGLPMIEQIKGRCDPLVVEPSLTPRERSERRVQRALVLIDLVRAGPAGAELDEAVRDDPSNVDALALRGRLALTNGDGTTAASSISAALVLRPKDPDLLATRAYISDSLDDANESLKLRPRNRDALWIRAALLERRSKAQQAEEDATSALAIDENDGRSRALRSRLRLTLGRFDGAIDDADRLLSDTPAHPMALQIRAAARGGKGDNQGALDDVTLALGPQGRRGGHPLMRALILQKAMLLVRLDRDAEAMDELAWLIENGGRPGVLKLQLYLRQNGFPEIAITGERSPLLDDAVRNCFRRDGCGPGLRI